MSGQAERSTQHDTVDQHPASALTVGPFRLLLVANLCYFLVGNALRFAFGWLVLDGLNRGEGWQGFIAFTLGIPAMFLMLHAGVWADRYDSKMVMLISQVGSIAVVASTAVLIASDRITIGWVVVMTLLGGVFQTIGQPVRASLIPALVRPDQLFNAIAANAIVMTMTLITGPVVAQLIGDRFGFDGVFVALTALLIVGTGFVLLLQLPGTAASAPAGPGETAPETASGIEQIKAGLAHVTGDRALRKLFLLLVVAGLSVNAAVMVTLQAYVSEELGRDSGDAGPLFALMGVGIAVTSAVVMKKGNMANKGQAFMRAMLVGSTMVVLMGRAPTYWSLFPLVLVMGLAGGFYINMNQGLIQANTPQHLMGRVMGLFSLVQVGLMPIGALVLGLAAEVIGIGNVMSIAGAIAFVCVAATYVRDNGLRTLS